MVHHSERLALRFEAGDHLRRVHPGLHDFDRDLTPDGTQLLGEPHLPHTAFAQLLQEAIRTESAGLKSEPLADVRVGPLVESGSSGRGGCVVMENFPVQNRIGCRR